MNFLVIYKSKKKTPNSFNAAGIYEQGYDLLWNFFRNPNPFPFDSYFWIKEEERRAFIFEYWKKLSILPSAKILDYNSRERMKEDIKSFNFFLFYITYFFKNASVKNFIVSNFIVKIFNSYTDFVSKNKEYNSYFLKQPSVVLKKYENFKSILDKNLLSLESNYPVDFSLKIIMSEHNNFDYFYLFPEPFDKFFAKMSHQSLFFRIYDKLSIYLIYLKDNLSFKRFFSFLNAKFFSLNLEFFFRDAFLNKKTTNVFLFDIVESVVVSDQNDFILKIDPYFDLTIFNDEYAFLLSDYLFFDFFEFEENLLTKESFSYMYDHFLYLTYENKLELFNSDLPNMKLSLEYALDLNIFFSKEISFLFSKIKDINNFINYKNSVSFNFLYSFYSDVFNNQEIGVNLVNVYNEATLLKYSIFEQYGDSPAGLLKNLQFNPGNTRSFFLQKINSLKERGNIQKFDSYALFLEKYLYSYYYNYSNQMSLISNNFNFKSMLNKQKTYSSSLDFFGNSHCRWVFSSLSSFDFIKLSYSLSYLNLVKFGSADYALDSKENQNFKDPLEAELLNVKNSASLLKYNIDFFNKVYILSEKFTLEDIFSFDEDLSHFRVDFFYITFLTYIKKISFSLNKFI